MFKNTIALASVSDEGVGRDMPGACFRDQAIVLVRGQALQAVITAKTRSVEHHAAHVRTRIARSFPSENSDILGSESRPR